GTAPGSSDRRAGHGFSAPRLGRTAQDSVRGDKDLHGGCASYRTPASNPRSGASVRDESRLSGGAVPSRGTPRRELGWIPVGDQPQAGAAGTRRQIGEKLESDGWRERAV